MKNSLIANNEIKLFEKYAKYAWPIHRLFVKRYLSKRCNTCALSENHKMLSKNGNCGFCIEIKEGKKVDTMNTENLKEMEKKMDGMINDAIGSGAHLYDALVLFSGGKDSSLLIHILKTRYPKLRILAITIDNGFMNPTALKNIKKIVKKLRVAHITLRPNPIIYEKTFAYALTHVRGPGCSETVDFLDGELFVDISRHIAAQMKIGLIIAGFSYEQVTRYLSWHSFEHDRKFELSKRTIAARVYNIEELTPAEYRSVWWDGTKYKPEDVARLIFPFYVWRFSEEYIKDKVIELKLVEKGNNSPLQTNNTLIPLQGLIDQKMLGCSSWEPEFSHLIRNGKADRIYWRNIFELLEYSAKTGHFISTSVDCVLKQLHLTRKDVGIKG